MMSLCLNIARKVYLVGRRGAAQAAFTAKELREVLGEFIELFVCLGLLVPVPPTFIHHLRLTLPCKIIRSKYCLQK